MYHLSYLHACLSLSSVCMSVCLSVCMYVSSICMSVSQYHLSVYLSPGQSVSMYVSTIYLYASQSVSCSWLTDSQYHVSRDVWVSEWSSTSGWGTCHTLVVVHPSLVPNGTQLSHVAPHSCLQATVATPQAMALTGWLNHVRVADGSETLTELGLAYLCM